MTYLTQTWGDINRDGVHDVFTALKVDLSYFGNPQKENLITDVGNDGTVDQTEIRHSLYEQHTGNAERLVQTYKGYDLDGDPATGPGGFEANAWEYLQYDAAGRVGKHGESSQDYNLDGYPDYTNETTNTYNVSGQITSAETQYYFDGQLGGEAPRIETFAYNTKGLPAEHWIDDPALYDFEIGHLYRYNSAGQLNRIQVIDEFARGDKDPHNEATFFWQKNGLLKESNYYDEFFTYDDPNIAGDHVLEVKTKFAYNENGLVKSELKIGAAFGDWHTVDKQLSEMWYDAEGREILRVVKADADANNVWDVGSEMVTATTWGEFGVESRTVDFNADVDSFIESQSFTSAYDDWFV